MAERSDSRGGIPGARSLERRVGRAVRSSSTSWPGNPSFATPSSVLAEVNAAAIGEALRRRQTCASTRSSSLTT